MALITGGGRGQGAAEAELFCREGARVLLTDVREHDGRERAEALRSEGHEAVYLRLDVSQAADWERAIELAQGEFGSIDILINNAGIVTLNSVADVPDDEWNEAVAINQTGVFLGMRAVVHGMRRNGGGSIVNISSIYGVNAVQGYFAYQASKGAVVQMTRAAAVDLAPDGIRVNCILPGLILTDMTTMEPEEAVARDIERTPLGRGGESAEVAYGALYLASDEAAYVTGAVLPIDGGDTAQ